MNFSEILKNKYFLSAAIVCAVGLFAILSYSNPTEVENAKNSSSTENTSEALQASEILSPQDEAPEVVVETEVPAIDSSENTGENK
jgi:hypothetical protein